MPMQGAISAEAFRQMVMTAARLHSNPVLLNAVEQSTTSCATWAGLLQSIFVENSLQLYSPGRNAVIDWAKPG